MPKSTQKTEKYDKSGTPSKKTDAKHAEVVSKCLKWFKNSWDYAQSNYHETWDDNWKLYNNERVDIGYEGITNTFVPMTFSTVETMVGALAGGKPSFDFVPTRPDQETDTKVLNSLLDYYWDADQWNLKVIHWIRSSIAMGTGVMYIYWDIDRPRIINVPLRDFIFDPRFSDIELAEREDGYAGRRYLTTISALKTYEIVNPETGETEPRFKNLERIPESGHSTKGEETDKERKEMFLGSTLQNAEEEQVEVLEFWTNDEVYSIANRKVCIETAENPYKAQLRLSGDKNPRGIIPFIPQRNYSDQSLFYGKSEIEPIRQQQELLNDLSNQNTDAITYALNPMWTLDPIYAEWTDKIESLPGAVYPFRPGALTPIQMPRIPTDAFNERMNIKNEIRETTATDQIVKGVSQPHRATATEVVTQVSQAGQRFNIKVTQIENEGFHRLARLVLQMVKLFVDEPTMVRVVGADGVRWEEFDPQMFEGEYEPRVQLETSVNSNKAAETQKYQELYVAMLDNENIKKDELTKLMLEKVFELDPDEASKLLAPPPIDMAGTDMGSQTGDVAAEEGVPPEAPTDLDTMEMSPEEVINLAATPPEVFEEELV